MPEFPKYCPPEPIRIENRTWPSKQIDKAPIMASVDLRDGNQAFANPMNVETKIRYFRMLTEIGFKEIEIAYPSASEEEFRFVRRLIEEKCIPPDVWIGVLTAAREDLIRKTLDAVDGAEHVIVHCYTATSELHRRFVFGKSAEETKEMVVRATKQIASACREKGYRYEFSPEEFSDSDPIFTADLCAAVHEAWGGGQNGNFIVNLPMTVERRPPNQFADMIEDFTRRYPYMDSTTLSVHTHNDQGMGVAASELAVLAGAGRVEGTLFGHGERTGNMDLMAFAMNLFSRGIRTGLDFGRMKEIAAFVAEVSEIPVHPRHPYAGSLVFTAFSGTHQDAIRKGMARRGEIASEFHCGWKVPYLHVDPKDIGRDYSALVRINSQSGKGGVAYVLEQVYGIEVPDNIRSSLSAAVKNYSVQKEREVTSEEILRIYTDHFAGKNNSVCY